jgi:hypothetical protein
MSFMPGPEAPLPRPAVARTGRKIALCGSHSASAEDAPWNDPSWEFWGHASSRAWYRREMDRYFDLHVRACWTRGGKKGARYPKWLAANTVPIYMQDKYPDVPASVKYRALWGELLGRKRVSAPAGLSRVLARPCFGDGCQGCASRAMHVTPRSSVALRVRIA